MRADVFDICPALRHRVSIDACDVQQRELLAQDILDLLRTVTDKI
jgi:hypothetical protein